MTHNPALNRTRGLWGTLGAVVVLVMGAFTLGEKLAGKPSTAGSPTVEFWHGYTISSLEQCGNAARDELALLGPTKLLPLHEETRVTSNFAVFGELTAWASCINAAEETIIYAAAAGVEAAEAQILRTKLAQGVSNRLQKRQ